ncbi:MAG: UDP-N-acetylmuramoyl-L-alanyl-D-glutamate--2,6-diaminopimelate ligase, partial [Bacteroidales bacterium]|nr:UDP-N-acetylmuramoyl-L-alanyl-D-glutamate--2,6-diaminopimelate ligase [Bacteroidales bacterium]
MTLQQLIRNIKTENTQGNLDVEIKAITSDSRQAAPGVCFIAVPGTKTDGHAYIQDTINKGVSAVVCMHIPDNAPDNVAFVVVADTADAIGKIASEFYRRPSEHLTLAGVTGTNGKTTTATLLYNMFRQMGHKAGLLSTVENRVDDKVYPAVQTTPDPITINRL